MSEEGKPIKRSEQLAPLSREHHEGLLFAWRIKQGLKKEIEPRTVSEYVNWIWNNHLMQHFRKEEEVLVPLMPEKDELMKRMLEEHEEIEAMILINQNIADPSNLIMFSDKLNDHIRFEERILFPHCENILSEYQLDFILKKIDVEAPLCGEWKNEFWK